jgi:hypothetical protein
MAAGSAAAIAEQPAGDLLNPLGDVHLLRILNTERAAGAQHCRLS